MSLPDSPRQPASPSAASSNTEAWRRDLLLLIAVFGFLLALGLGHAPLANPDEGRYAEIGREMVASGDWVTPRLNGVNYFEKPPFVYWLVASAERLFPQSEWAIRSIPALFGLAGILLTYAAGRRLFGRNAGLAAAVVLGTSLLYFALSRILILDMAVSVLVSATLFCFILGVNEPPGRRRRLFFYGLYASAALATLTKGLMGFLIPGAVMFLWLLLFNQWKRLRPLHLPTGLLLFLAIALPWHVLVAQRNPTWFHRYIVYEHWLRFSTSAASRPGPWWYFIPVVIGGLFPWIGFLGSAIRKKLRWSARRENLDAWFLFTWAAFIFLFFSKSQSKLIPYILPVFPPLAVLIGTWLASAFTEKAVRLRFGLRIFATAALVLAVAVIAVVFNLIPTAKPIIREPGQAAALQPYAIAVAVVLAGGALVTLWLAAFRSARATLLGIAGTAALFLAALIGAVPAIQKPGTKELALYVKAHAQPGDRVMTYHEFFHDFTYYAERVVDIVNYKGELELEEDPAASASGRFMDDSAFRILWAQPQRLYVVARKKDVDAVRNGQPTHNLFADPSFRYHLIAESRDHYLFSNLP